MPRLRSWSLVGLTVATLGLAGCSSSSSSPSTTTAPPLVIVPVQNPSPGGSFGSKPTVTVPPGAPPTQLESTDLIVGTGPAAKAGDNVTVQDVGVAYSSRLRPVQNFRPSGRQWNFNIDLFIVDWLERLGGDYDVITEEDLHREGLDLLKPYRVVLTGCHPEYDSVEMLDALQAYLRRGGRFMYMGGNGFYWKIAHHPTRSGVIEVRRAEGGVRAWAAEPGCR